MARLTEIATNAHQIVDEWVPLYKARFDDPYGLKVILRFKSRLATAGVRWSNDQPCVTADMSTVLHAHVADAVRWASTMASRGWRGGTPLRVVVWGAVDDPAPAELDVHLAGAKRQRLAEVWVAQRGGMDEVLRRVEGANVVVLMLCARALAEHAEALFDLAQHRAEAGQSLVIPMLTGPADLTGFGLRGRFPVGEPVLPHTGYDRDAILVGVARAIRMAAEGHAR